MRKKSVLFPIGNENVRLALLLRIPVGGEDEFLPIACEHGEPIEGFVEGNLLEVLPVRIDQEQVEVSAFRVLHVGGKNNSFACLTTSLLSFAYEFNLTCH